eukprot:scaffold7219_cov129-Isochrysis_galbana.AAC.3
MLAIRARGANPRAALIHHDPPTMAGIVASLVAGFVAGLLARVFKLLRVFVERRLEWITSAEDEMLMNK